MAVTPECVIGIDYGGTQARACVGYRDGNIGPIVSERADFSKGNEGVTEHVIRLVRESVDKADIGLDDIASIGIGTAGQPTKDNHIKNAANCPFPELTFPADLQSELHKPVAARNDVAVAVYAARERGHGREFAHLEPRWDAAMTISTGTNLAVMYDGELLLNSGGQSPEWGHVPLNVDGNRPECGCGGRGCIETYIAGSGIANRTRKLLSRGYMKGDTYAEQAKHPILAEAARRTGLSVVDSQTEEGLSSLLRLIGNLRSEDVYRAYRRTARDGKPDELAAKIVDETSTYMARAFGNVLGSYPNIPYVEVFGSVAENNRNLTVKAAMRKLTECRYANRDFHEPVTQFLITELPNIGLRGAVVLAQYSARD